MYSAHKARQPEDCMLQCTTQKVLACSTALFCSVLGSLWTVSVQCSCGTWYWQFCAAVLRIMGDVCVTTLVHLYKGLLSSIQCCCGLWYLLLAKYYWVLDTYSSMQRCCGLWDISTTLVLWYLQFYAAVLRNLALILLRYMVLTKYYWVLAVLCSSVTWYLPNTIEYLQSCAAVLRTVALILLWYLVLAKYYWVLAVLCSSVADCGCDK